MRSAQMLLLLALLAGAAAQADGDLRLFGGDSPRIGRLEVFHDDNWGTICDDDWSTAASTVACRQMFGASSVPLSQSHGDRFGTVDAATPIWLDNVQCAGDETRLTDCSHAGWSVNDCVHQEDQTLECSDGSDDTAGVTEGDIRLAGGPTQYEGRLEIFHNGVWGTVCNDRWDVADSLVACRSINGSLPLNGGLRATRQYGLGAGLIWLDEVACDGDETALSACPNDGYGIHDCRHVEDVSLQCAKVPRQTATEGAVRLTGGPSANEGRLEIFHDGYWGSVCRRGWTHANADVACYNAGFDFVSVGLLPVNTSAARPAELLVWLQDIQCDGSETDLAACTNPGYGVTTCTPGDDVWMACRPIGREALPTNGVAGQLRIVGGATEREGLLERWDDQAGAWQTICAPNWGAKESEVVCRQLFGARVASAKIVKTFSGGRGLAGLGSISCTGGENNLLDCTIPSTQPLCGHETDVALSCMFDGGEPAVEGQLRQTVAEQVGHGVLQVYHAGRWGTVCEQGWSLYDADVACRQMYGLPARQPLDKEWSVISNYGADVPIFLSGLSCFLGAPSLTSCPHDWWGMNSCNHLEDVGLRCYTATDVDAPQQGDIKLEYGTEGRILVFNSGRWGTVCHDRWTIANAQVACRQVGMKLLNPLAANRATPEEDYGITLDDVSCDGDEDRLVDCAHAPLGVHDCSHRSDVYVVCTDDASDIEEGTLRLNGEARAGTIRGRLEIYYNDMWSTICTQGFDKADAQVACRQLYGTDAVSWNLDARFFGGGSGPMALTNVACEGDEEELAACQSVAMEPVLYLLTDAFDECIQASSDRTIIERNDVGLVCVDPDAPAPAKAAEPAGNGGAVAAGILVPLFILGGAAAAFIFFRRRRKASRGVELRDDAGDATAAGGDSSSDAADGSVEMAAI